MIALFVHDTLIRPYIGDLLVVILIYCFLKSFLNTSSLWLATGVLLFACCIELLQSLAIIDVLGLRSCKLARVVIGTSFSWEDLFAYVAGILIALASENLNFKKIFTP